MDTLDCQLDYSRNEVQYRNGGLTCDLDIKEGRQYTFDWKNHTPLLQIVRQEDTPLIWAIPSTGSLIRT